jgi:hypothetical protein
MKRLANAETGGFRLDLYRTDAVVFRAEVRDAEEAIVFSATAGHLVGEGSVFEKVRNHFLAQRREHTAVALIAEAEAELRISDVDVRPVAPGWRVTEVIAHHLARMCRPVFTTQPKLSFELTADQRAEVAAAAAIAVKKTFSVHER